MCAFLIRLSSNKVALLSGIWIGLMSTTSVALAQQKRFPQHRLLVDGLGWHSNRLCVEYELSIKPSWSVAVQGFVFRYPEVNVPFVVGQQTVYFGLWRVDTFGVYSPLLLRSSGWRYMDNREALPLLPEQMPIAATGGMVVFSNRLPLFRESLEFVLRSGIFGGYYSYYRTSNSLLILDEFKESITDTRFRIQRHLVVYEQKRFVTYGGLWFGGICTQAALRWAPVRFLNFELRGVGFMNIGHSEDKAIDTPAASLYAYGSLWVGITFGRKPKAPHVESTWVETEARTMKKDEPQEKHQKGK
ncbi:MAG: hypothetical protein NZM43_08845 [Saprospiraceae bacterium]|nr:hypothetical protein [Saprospiraceae bacterium]MDW8484419.1 hypothetical protein [Saprospiraceae bacterium]